MISRLVRDISSTKLMAILSAMAIISSYWVEFGLHRPPCHFCILQRYSYITLFILLVYKCLSTNSKADLFALGPIFFGIGIGVVQLLSQLGLVGSRCSSSRKISSLEAFSHHLETAQNCDTISWSVFNIPISFFSVIMLGIFGIIIIHSYAREKKALS